MENEQNKKGGKDNAGIFRKERSWENEQNKKGGKDNAGIFRKERCWENEQNKKEKCWNIYVRKVLGK